MKTMSKILSIVLVLAMVMSFALVAHAEGASATYTFADYKIDGELGGGEGIRQLDDDVKFTISSGWFSTEARIYKNENGVITSAKEISSIVLNAGYKDSTFDVYTSTDGVEWTMYQEDVAYVKGYGDVEVAFTSPVKYIKIDAPNAQVRIKTLTVNFAEVAEEEPEAPAGTAIADGDYVIYVPAYNKALSSVYGGYYNNGVDVTVADGVVSGYGETEIWTVTNNDDGTISLSFGGKNLGMADSFTSMTLGEAHDKWVLSDAGNGLFYAMNTVREAYVEWYDGKSYWSAYYNINAGSEGMFALAFYPIVEEEPEQPEEPAKVDYYVAGQDTLCGSNWNPGDEANIMTQGEDGLYTKVYENVAAGVYELKVTVGDWTESWGDATSTNGNYFATVEALSTVTVIFDAETKTVSVEIVPVETEPENPGEGGEVNPGTGDMAIAGLALAMMAATAGVVVLKKKEF